MTKSEKRLLKFALFIFFFGVIPFFLYPIATDFYNNYWQSIDKLQQDIQRYRKLAQRADFWQQENQRAKFEQQQIESSLLSGKNRQLVGAKMQSIIKKLAKKNQITFKSLEPPDTSFSTEQWLLVIQSIQFEANSTALLKFLQALERHYINLQIISLEIRRYSNKLSGSIKIIGFSRLPVK
jgi:DNA repair ATPase RecN